MATTQHTIVALVQDKPGVLNRMVSLFRRRGFNIDSIAVGHSETPEVSRVTIVVDGTNVSVEQVRKQLDKVVDVVKVTDLTGDSMISRELALIKVKTSGATRGEIIELCAVFRANIVDVAMDSVTIEATGDDDKIEGLINLLHNFGIKEIVRTGRIALLRGATRPQPVQEDTSLKK